MHHHVGQPVGGHGLAGEAHRGEGVAFEQCALGHALVAVLVGQHAGGVVQRKLPVEVKRFFVGEYTASKDAVIENERHEGRNGKRSNGSSHSMRIAGAIVTGALLSPNVAPLPW